ncbi:MAG: helix-turn-helix domain-containing protein [Candidatus Gastranaerophilales bacterium]|nr:helix-turn-helix domain-containing protein [Candidatus Gastranaerophilales bacterium]
MAKQFTNLYAEIVRAGLNQRIVADMLQISTSTLSRKMNGKEQFKLDEMYKIVDEINKTRTGNKVDISFLFQLKAV